MESKGFTVIEMIVALGIFSILLVATMGSFMSGFASQKKILEIQAVQRDGAYLMEILSREIRMASDTTGMSLPPSASGSSSLTFVNHDGRSVTYCRANIDGNGNPVCTGANSGDYFAMINNDTGERTVMNSANVKMSNLVFYASNTDGSGNYDSAEPMITVSMTLQSAKDPRAKMTLQTGVSMRLYYKH